MKNNRTILELHQQVDKERFESVIDLSSLFFVYPSPKKTFDNEK